MKKELDKLVWGISLFLIALIVTFLNYRPAGYYYFMYDNNPVKFQFQKFDYKPNVANGAIIFGYELTYGTGLSIFLDKKFSIFGYDSLEKFIYKLSDGNVAICNSKWVGNCLSSSGEWAQKLLESLSK